MKENVMFYGNEWGNGAEQDTINKICDEAQEVWDILERAGLSPFWGEGRSDWRSGGDAIVMAPVDVPSSMKMRLWRAYGYVVKGTPIVGLVYEIENHDGFAIFCGKVEGGVITEWYPLGVSAGHPDYDDVGWRVELMFA